MTTKICDRLFVYGTLRNDPGHEMYHVLARSANFLGEARMRGEMFDLGEYPGVVVSDDPRTHVVGELYELKPSETALALDILDSYEECAPNQPEPQEYRRQIARVELNGIATDAWVYVLNSRPVGAIPIPGGDYLAWCRRGRKTQSIAKAK